MYKKCHCSYSSVHQCPPLLKKDNVNITLSIYKSYSAFDMAVVMHTFTCMISTV